MKKISLSITALFSMFLSAMASAEIDTTATTTTITTDGGAAIAAIGTAMMGLAALAVVYKWGKASIFG